MYIQNGVLVIISKIKKNIQKLSSMRVHLFATLFLISMLSAVMMAVLILNEYRSRSTEQRVSAVEGYAKRLANQMVFNGYLSGGNQVEINAEMGLAAEMNNGRIVVADSSLKIVYDSYGREEGKVLISEKVIKCLRGIDSVSQNMKNQFAEITVPLLGMENKEALGVILFNFSLNSEYMTSSILQSSVLIMLLVAAILLIVFAFFYSNKMTKPLKEIVKSIHHVTEGYMDVDISVKGYYEINKITESVNEMLHKMQLLESSRQEFVSNVSHELKTPMTSIKVLADSLMQQEDAPVELYREFLSDINDEIERENKIITDLLSLVKLDKNTGEMHIAQVNINELLEIILKRLKPIAQRRNIELVFESFRPVVAEVDEVKISLGVSNLIENAIKYNVDDGWVRVSLNADHKYFYVKVSDSGIGIPEEAQGQIFERFYRVDRARARQTGGTGLGLSITKNVVLMHNGAVKVSSKENEGTTFSMRIPLSYVS